MNEPKKFDFAVAYRVFYKMGRPPNFPEFGGNKFLLTKVAFRSFKRAISPFKVKLWVLLGDCPPEYETFFRAEWLGVQIVYDINKSHTDTFQEQYTILTQQEDSEFCCLLEDDYFYLPEAFTEIFNLFKNHSEVDFASPYDHAENYQPFKKMAWQTMATNRLPFWRIVPDTTSTFVARREALIACRVPMRSFGKPHAKLCPFYVHDRGKWMAITQFQVFNPAYFLQCLFWRSPFTAWCWLTAWVFCWRHIIFSRKRNLWQPMPGLATHLIDSAALLSPGYDWHDIISKAVRDELNQIK